MHYISTTYLLKSGLSGSRCLHCKMIMNKSMQKRNVSNLHFIKEIRIYFALEANGHKLTVTLNQFRVATACQIRFGHDHGKGELIFHRYCLYFFLPYNA